MTTSLQSDSIPSEALAFSIENGHALALWRMPESNETHLYLDDGETAVQSDLDLENGPEGFVFSPFQISNECKGHLVRPDRHWVKRDGSGWEQLRGNPIPKRGNSAQSPARLPEIGNGSVDEKGAMSHYVQMVKEGISQIREGRFQKLVLSRRNFIPGHYAPTDVFDGLSARYPTAFVSMVFLPGEGVWMGATPERLVQVTRDHKFKTVALAGTQALDGMQVSQARWSQKEIEEQALVSRYIIGCFKKLRLREYLEVGPQTIAAGNLMHLRTDFSVDMLATGHLELGSQMLQLLHPTSAVCGMPREAAQEFILANEGWDRRYFSGFLGPINQNNGSELFVNLRSMRLGSEGAMLYAGAGITRDSDPIKEWEETELKCQTLLAVM